MWLTGLPLFTRSEHFRSGMPLLSGACLLYKLPRCGRPRTSEGVSATTRRQPHLLCPEANSEEDGINRPTPCALVLIIFEMRFPADIVGPSSVLPSQLCIGAVIGAIQEV